MKILPVLSICAACFAGTTEAATLSLGGLSGTVNQSVVVLPEATLTSSGRFFFDGASDVPDSFCALRADAFRCEADLTIAFSSVVSNLFLQVSGYDGGDFVALDIFGLGDALLGTVDLTGDVLSLDLSSFGSITRLFFDDSSTGAGFAYSDFSFDQTAAVPLPASLPLLAAGMGLLAVARRRSRKS